MLNSRSTAALKPRVRALNKFDKPNELLQNAYLSMHAVIGKSDSTRFFFGDVF